MTDMVKIKAIDVKPNRWSYRCYVGDDPALHDIEICSRKWSDDGKHIWFMLESHNFVKADPDEEMELVPYTSPYCTPARLLESDAMDAARMAKRPTVSAPCVTCGHISSPNGRPASGGSDG